MSDIELYKNTWIFLHLIGSSFNVTNKSSSDAFVCIFQCLQDLSGNKDIRATIHEFNDFMATKGLSIEQFVINKEKAFEWTYLLHEYCNWKKRKTGQFTSRITLEQAHEIYNTKNWTKDKWGRHFWFMIHYLASNLPCKPDGNITEDVLKKYTSFIISICVLLPCNTCSNHMYTYLKQHNVSNYNIYNSKFKVFAWGYNFHQQVTHRVNNENSMNTPKTYNETLSNSFNKYKKIQYKKF